MPFGKKQATIGSVTVLERLSGTKRWLDMARILIIDTQAELRHQLVRLFEQAGHRATAVATVSEAANILEKDVPDLLATNVVLTDGSGARLAKQAEAAGAQILMITGSPDRMIEFDGSGQRYLSKPFPPEAFLRRVEEMLAAA
jgi:two-component system, OmpR family, response regulator